MNNYLQQLFSLLKEGFLLFFTRFHILFLISFLFLGIIILIEQLIFFIFDFFDIPSNISLFDGVFLPSLLEYSILEILGILIVLFSMLFFFYLFFIFFTELVFYSIEKKYSGKSYKTIFKLSFQKLLPTSLSLLLFYGLLFFLFILLIIPGVIFYIYTITLIPILLLTNSTGINAIKKSISLIRNNGLFTLFFLIGYNIISFITFFIITYLLEIVSNKYASSFLLVDIFEFINLIFVVLIIAFGITNILVYFQFLSKKAPTPNSSTSQTQEKIMKDYVEEYKKAYSKQAIQNALEKQFDDSDKIKEIIDEHY